MVANCFQKVLDVCIDSAQSAFVSGRLILDNALLAYEILHTFCQKRLGRKVFMALKLYMSKAYDWVEWGFLRAIMERMSFKRASVDNVMKWVSTIFYSVRINGSMGSSFDLLEDYDKEIVWALLFF